MLTKLLFRESGTHTARRTGLVTFDPVLLCTRPYPNIIFMSGAHGVAGWVWGGDGWVFVDRRLFHVVASAWVLGFGAVVFGNTLGSREGVLYDEIYIMLIEK